MDARAAASEPGSVEQLKEGSSIGDNSHYGVTGADALIVG